MDTLTTALRLLANNIDCEDGVAIALVLQAAGEIDRLRPTPEERDCLWTAAEAYGENNDDPECERIAVALQGLWERTK